MNVNVWDVAETDPALIGHRASTSGAWPIPTSRSNRPS